jgi:hypothetical protein
LAHRFHQSCRYRSCANCSSSFPAKFCIFNICVSSLLFFFKRQETVNKNLEAEKLFQKTQSQILKNSQIFFNIEFDSASISMSIENLKSGKICKTKIFKELSFFLFNLVFFSPLVFRNCIEFPKKLALKRNKLELCYFTCVALTRLTSRVVL